MLLVLAVGFASLAGTCRQFWAMLSCSLFVTVSGMPLTKLTDAQSQADLAEKHVPHDVQLALFHAGFINLRLFAGLDESRAEVRDALAKEIGLKHTDDVASRIAVASVLAAWESSRLQSTAEEKLRVESRLGQWQRVAQLSEMAAMCAAVEAEFGVLRDSEVPAKWPRSLNSLSKVRLKLKTCVRCCA